MKEWKVYCDMDGVLTDFDRQFQTLSGADPDTYEEMYGKKRLWKLVSTGGEAFWREMPWMEGGRELWKFLQKFQTTLLSTPSLDPRSSTGKKKWVHLNMDPVPNLILSSTKESYATPNSILIDDRKSNLRKWKEAGGIPILCRDGKTEEVIKKLVQLGLK